MVRTNVVELKARLSEYLKKVDAGENVVVYRHNKAIATLSRVSEAPIVPRVVGPMPGAPVFDVPASFFEPMPEQELTAWEGGEAGAPEAPPLPTRMRRAPSAGPAARSRSHTKRPASSPRPARTPSRRRQ